MPLLEAEDLVVVLGRTRVLRGVSFGIDGPACVGIVGPNGSGKTTLLRAVSGNQPYDGLLRLDGREVASWPARTLARRLAFVRQALPVSFDFTVEELVLLGRAPHRGWLEPFETGDRERAHAALDEVGLGRYAQTSVLALSGGERQRALLAQALVQEAPMLLLDEPTAHLDVHFQHAFMHRVRALAGGGRTVLTVFHDLELAARFADRLLVLDDGRLAAVGPPADVLTPDLIARVFRMKADVEAGDDLTIRYRHPLDTTER